MIIKGGQVFILEDDVLPVVTITKAIIFMEMPDDSSMDEMAQYLNKRCGNGTTITDCTFQTVESWADERMRKAIGNAKSDLHLKSAPLGRRIMEFFGMVKA